MVRALRIIAPREHSTLELRRKLRTRGYDTTTIDRVIAELIDQDYLSDDRFADLYVQQRVDRGDGPFKIRNALRKRGISDRISNGLIRNDDEYWLERAQAAHDKKYPVGIAGSANRVANCASCAFSASARVPDECDPESHGVVLESLEFAASQGCSITRVCCHFCSYLATLLPNDSEARLSYFS